MAKKSDPKTHPHGAELDRLEAEENEKQLARDAEVYDELLIAAGGGDATPMTDVVASAILAMLDDPKYAAEVKKKHRVMHGEDDE